MTTAWKERKLGDLIRVKHGFAFLGEHFSDTGTHIVLTPGNFFDAGGFKDKGDKEKWYRGPIPDGYVLSAGDVIVAMTEQAEGLLGSSAIIPTGDLYLHNQRLGLVELIDPTEADSRFIYYLFNSKPVRQQIRSSASGAKIRHTAPSRIEAVSVVVPPLPIQQRIAGILSAYDDLIENCQRRIKILESMARALYREWFVHFRFPGHEGHRHTDSALGKIPAGWGVRKLDAVASVNRSKITARNAPAEIHYIDISSVSPDRIESAKTYAFADAPGRARRVVQHGDILWSCVRPNRRSHARAMHPQPDTIASTGFAVLTPEQVPLAYLYYATTTEDFVAYLTNNATGAAYPAVTAATFERADVLVPPEPLLRDFARATTPMMEAVHVLDGIISNAQEARNLVLPRLLSGQIDVSTSTDAVDDLLQQVPPQPLPMQV